MTVLVDIKDNRIYINSESYDKDRCRSIPGARWNKDARQWHTPLSWAACKQLRQVFGTRLEIGQELFNWAKEEVESRIKPSLELRSAMEIKDTGGFPHGLYPFQFAGALFLLTAQNALLGDSVGAGKTIQVLAAAQARNLIPMLVICPNSMKRTWARETQKWWPNVPVHVVEGSAKKRQQILDNAGDDQGVTIINWESIRLHSRLAPYGSLSLTDKEKEVKELNQIPFKLVVADEAHKMRDPRSKQTRSAWAIAHGPTVNYRWALSGTPMTSAPDTLYPVLHFLDPKEWPSKTAFIDRYCNHQWNVWGGLDVFGIRPEMQDEFFSILDPRFRRMPKEIILPQLPPIVYETRHVEMTPKQAKAYEAMATTLCTELDGGSMLIATNPIAQLTRLTQYASAYIEDTPDGPKLTNPSCKLDQLMEDLEDFSEPMVVFAQSRQLINMASQRLEQAKIKHMIIQGGQTVDQRQNSIDSFQNGEVDIILVVTQAGGVGITLNRSRIAIFLSLPWSMVDYSQAVGRVHRIGSEIHESVVIVTYICQGTVEEGQIAVLNGKAKSLEEIVRDKEALRRFLHGGSEGP